MTPPYQPKQGDIVMMNFNPQAGHEQGGRRPALIVSNASFHRYTRMAIVARLRIRSKIIQCTSGLITAQRPLAEILCEHVKSLELSPVVHPMWKRCPMILLQDVLDRVRLSIE